MPEREFAHGKGGEDRGKAHGEHGARGGRRSAPGEPGGGGEHHEGREEEPCPGEHVEDGKTALLRRDGPVPLDHGAAEALAFVTTGAVGPQRRHAAQEVGEEPLRIRRLALAGAGGIEAPRETARLDDAFRKEDDAEDGKEPPIGDERIGERETDDDGPLQGRDDRIGEDAALARRARRRRSRWPSRFLAGGRRCLDDGAEDLAAQPGENPRLDAGDDEVHADEDERDDERQEGKAEDDREQETWPLDRQARKDHEGRDPLQVDGKPEKPHDGGTRKRGRHDIVDRDPDETEGDEEERARHRQE